MESDPANPKLYLQHLDILINTLPIDVTQVVTLLEKAMEQEMPEKHKMLFSQRKVEFLEDFGSDINALLSAKTKHDEFIAKLKESDKSGDPGSGEKNGASNGSTASYPPVTNSSSYTAQQTQVYWCRVYYCHIV